jgi:hypothetical protein
MVHLCILKSRKKIWISFLNHFFLAAVDNIPSRWPHGMADVSMWAMLLLRKDLYWVYEEVLCTKPLVYGLSCCSKRREARPHFCLQEAASSNRLVKAVWPTFWLLYWINVIWIAIRVFILPSLCFLSSLKSSLLLNLHLNSYQTRSTFRRWCTSTPLLIHYLFTSSIFLLCLSCLLTILVSHDCFSIAVKGKASKSNRDGRARGANRQTWHVTRSILYWFYARTKNIAPTGRFTPREPPCAMRMRDAHACDAHACASRETNLPVLH